MISSVLLCMIGLVSVAAMRQHPVDALANAAHSVKDATKSSPITSQSLIEPDSSSASGYMIISYSTGSTCQTSNFEYAFGYKSNACLPQVGSGSYMIKLKSSSSCSGGTITFYSDNYCQTVQNTGSIVSGCTVSDGESYTIKCSKNVYSPVYSYYLDMYVSTTSDPGCSGSPAMYEAFPLNTCEVSSPTSYNSVCEDGVVVYNQYSDDSCNDVDTSSDLYNACTAITFYDFFVSGYYTCSAESMESSAKPKALGLSRIVWVFIGVGVVLVLFSLVMIVRWYQRRNRPPKETNGEVKMVTLFSSTNSNAAVKYTAAPVELRI